MYLVTSTLAGAAQFSAAAAIVTFLEDGQLTSQPPNKAARILGYSYNSLGTAATVNLRLAPAAGVAANLEIPLETPASAVNSFTNICGPGGLVVPRTAMAGGGVSFVVLFSTVGKDDAGTFRLWYAIGDVDE